MRIIVPLVFVSLFSYGQTINEQIHALEKATTEERVELMNNIKKQLVSMNAERRMQTIEVLKEQLEHKNDGKEGTPPVEHHIVLEENTETSSESSDDRTIREEMVHNEEATHIHNELHQHDYQHQHDHGEK